MATRLRKPVDPTFGPTLKAERLACGLTQTALAARTGISVDYIRDLEQGQRGVPSPAYLERISDALMPPPPPGTVALSPKRFKRHRRWKPECPKCHQKDRSASCSTTSSAGWKGISAPGATVSCRTSCRVGTRWRSSRWSGRLDSGTIRFRGVCKEPLCGIPQAPGFKTSTPAPLRSAAQPPAGRFACAWRRLAGATFEQSRMYDPTWRGRDRSWSERWGRAGSAVTASSGRPLPGFDSLPLSTKRSYAGVARAPARTLLTFCRPLAVSGSPHLTAHGRRR